MDWDWRTVLILLGLLAVVIIILDGIRRMRKARAEALKMDISNEFKFPDDDHNPELPGGGFRVVDRGHEAVGSTPEDAREATSAPAKPTQPSRVMRARTLSEGAAEATRSEEYSPLQRREPTLGGELPSTDDQPLEEPLAASPDDRVVSSSRQSDKESGKEDLFASSLTTWLDDKEGENIIISEEIADNAAKLVHGHAAIIPKAKPIDLDEEVPILMSVETLGDREVVIDPDSGEKADPSSEADVAGESETESDSEPQAEAASDSMDVADPYLDREVEAAEDAIAPQGKDLVIFANEDADQLSERGDPEVVLVIHAFCRNEAGFPGQALLHLFDACDFRFGNEGIFHRYEEADGRGPIQFSVSQTFEPGVFDPTLIDQQSFAALTFFMSLPGANRPLEAYLAMSEMARVFETQLDAELLDSSRSAFTRQTVEHDRQQIMDYERRQKLNARKMAAEKRR
jgi:cell division protein ZipA